MTVRGKWRISGLLSLLLVGVLTLQWAQLNRYQATGESQLTDRQSAERYIEVHWDRDRAPQSPGSAPARRIRTGIFIQSLKFFNSSEVNLTGYIWQHYRDGIHDDIKPAPGEAGFILPERVDTTFPDTEAYRRRTADGEVIGWYFEATLRQPFDYATYPFDHKTVWVRMWHREPNAAVLVPDYDAYDSTRTKDVFGIDESIVLGGWRREDTFFNYRSYRYDTNFGEPGYLGQQGFPELHYNFVIKRRFGNAFIVHLLPLFLVAALLFGMLLTVGDDENAARRHGYSTSAMIGACSALFFVVLLAHIHLREQFPSPGIVYLEYFYIVMYCALGLSAAYSYLLSQGALTTWPLTRLRDPDRVKVAYWPVLLAALIAITGFVQLQN